PPPAPMYTPSTSSRCAGRRRWRPSQARLLRGRYAVEDQRPAEHGCKRRETLHFLPGIELALLHINGPELAGGIANLESLLVGVAAKPGLGHVRIPKGSALAVAIAVAGEFEMDEGNDRLVDVLRQVGAGGRDVELPGRPAGG